MILAALMPATAMAATPLWMRDAKISPDGRSIAFCYRGDIYTVPVAGGKATRVTAGPAYEATPVWSPDSRRLAYASDLHGNFDIYGVDAAGGTPERITFNSAAETPEAWTPDGRSVLFSASIQDPAASALFPSGRMTELYSVPAGGGAPRQVLGTPARSVSWLPGGRQFLYQDVKGFEDEWRKHHTSSVTRDVWLYDTATGSHTNLTDLPGEDTNPVAGADGEMYFLSERGGLPVNVYRAAIKPGAQAEAVTSFKTHPVRFLSRAADGRLAFTWDGELYTLAPGASAPAKVAVDITVDAAQPAEKMPVRSGARAAVPSPDGKSIAFVWRGDIFVTSTDYSTTRQITRTAAAEDEPTWGKDSRTLYYSSERDGRINIYKATMERDDEPDMARATLIKEEPVFKADSHERGVPRVSPDGSRLAFILDRNTLAVRDLDSGKTRSLTDGSTYQQRDGKFAYTWSPDSRWIALEVIDRKHDPYSDIALLDVATGKWTNLTNSGYFDAQPVWVMGGDAIMFVSERYGMRNHASWGSMMDVMLVFLNQEALDRWQLGEEDLALVKEAEKKAAKEDKADAKDGGKKDSGKDDKKDSGAKAINVELDGITERIVRVTPQSVDLHDAFLSSDGETLYYLTDAPDGMRLWKFKPREDEHKLVTTLPGSAAFHAVDGGKTAFLLGGSMMKKLDPKSDKLTNITYSATATVDRAAEREAMYDNMAREVAARFYVEDMHGVDWPAMTAAYRRFLPHISNNYDYAELLSELLGELNASHTGGRYGGAATSQADRTASLGLLYDLTYTGPGVRIAEVVAGGPMDRAASKAAPGVVIEKLDGEEIAPGTDLSALLTDRAGRRTLLSMRLPGGERVDEVVKPVSAGRMSELMYRRWVRSRAAAVDSLSGGRLGYVHLESMDDESFRRAYSDLLGKYNDREGIVIDVRWNGGGRLHEDIEVLFSGQKYFTQEIRGTETCDMPSRRWNKPSIMVMGEACYSNAHGTPWVYSHRGLGKLVGMPVPGTMTSVNWVRMQDPTLVYGIPVIGYRLPDGSFLENQQLEPDIRVANSPAEVVRGTDAQLATAVKELLRQIDSTR